MRTRAQEYALKSFEQVSSMLKEKDSDRAKYGTIAHKLPVLIKKAGMAQAFGFVESKQEKAYARFLENLSELIGIPDLPQASRKAQLQEYMHITSEVMSALTWYKRFAVSVLNVESGSDAEDGGY